ncbi:hypothetical protein [Nonomuraea sp. NPDC050310]|uniref:hypothetical protein n=1 Tax=unclassified Nonomuraea TaxID=2593643 RepID=UPI0033ECA95C
MTPELWGSKGPGGEVAHLGEVAATDELLTALSRGEAPDPHDPAARLLALLVEDVGQRRSSVSMTPST